MSSWLSFAHAVEVEVRVEWDEVLVLSQTPKPSANGILYVQILVGIAPGIRQPARRGLGQRVRERAPVLGAEALQMDGDERHVLAHVAESDVIHIALVDRYGDGAQGDHNGRDDQHLDQGEAANGPRFGCIDKTRRYHADDRVSESAWSKT